ncbi:MAG: hypothetical protein NC453_21735 [Muribaculum sp.]|nr:hypothetical protein [Muribaculum sp.]
MINLAEMLQRHEGERFYSPTFGTLRFMGIIPTTKPDEKAIRLVSEQFPGESIWFYKDGRYHLCGEINIFPSSQAYEGYRSNPEKVWREWNENHHIISYDDVKQALFTNFNYLRTYSGAESFCFFSDKQFKKLIAINQLTVVQKYLERGWQPNWKTKSDVYYIAIDTNIDTVCVRYKQAQQCADIYFSSKVNAEKAIKILGESTIREALSTDW